jgi:hypothetical protein
LQLYQHCELFLLTPRTERAGHFEGFGLVYLEAGACGKPVIGTSECGAEDAILDGQTGLLVRPDDVEGLSAALRSLLSDGNLARKLGDEGRRRAKQAVVEQNRRADCGGVSDRHPPVRPVRPSRRAAGICGVTKAVDDAKAFEAPLTRVGAIEGLQLRNASEYRQLRSWQEAVEASRKGRCC